MRDVIATLTEVVHRERGALSALARREGLGDEDALDCVQEAFCVFLRRSLAGDLPEEASWAPFLAGIVRNLARNGRRLHARSQPHVTLEVERYADSGSIDEALADAEEHVRLHACIARLCDTQRAVVTMRMLEERDGEDVAAALGVSRNYVDVLAHRARGALRSCMTESFQSEQHTSDVPPPR